MRRKIPASEHQDNLETPSSMSELVNQLPTTQKHVCTLVRIQEDALVYYCSKISQDLNKGDYQR